MKIQASVAFLSLTLLGITGACQAQNANDSRPVGQKWVGTWATSAQQIDEKELPPPPGLTDTTIRQNIRVSLGGKQVRVRFSNAFGPYNDGLRIYAASIAVSAGKSAIKPETSKALTFHGEPIAIIQRGAMVISDPVDFELAPNSDLAVTIRVKDPSKTFTGHRSARGTTYLGAGDLVSAPELTEPTKTTQWYYLSGVDVLAPQNAATIVTLGDSITDGKGSTDDANRRWPDLLSSRLRSNKSTANIGVLNQGIGGNTLYEGGLGQPALTRIERDVLAQPGVRWLVVFGGINDLGGKKTTAQQIIATLQQIVWRAHDRDLRVVGATILPCEGSFYFTPELEIARQQVNTWIRTSGTFDAVFDFDAVLRDPAQPSKMLAIADSGDKLHPNDEGYRRMAESIDLKVFKSK